MKNQYPYTLQILPKQEVIKDANGDFMDVDTAWETLGKCRDEAGRNYKVNSPDGVGYVATVLIFAPKGTDVIAPGATVRVMDGDICRATGKVIISRKEFFHTRIWL
jgi:hypothetical protein